MPIYRGKGTFRGKKGLSGKSAVLRDAGGASMLGRFFFACKQIIGENIFEPNRNIKTECNVPIILSCYFHVLTDPTFALSDPSIHEYI